MISVDFNAFSRSLHFSLFRVSLYSACSVQRGRVDEQSTNFMHASVE
jgi:hypothetical protein